MTAVSASAVPKAPAMPPPAVTTKSLAESDALTSGYIPSTHVYNPKAEHPNDVVLDPGDILPVIDYAMLISGDPDQRSKAVRELGRACQEWGFFMVINHGVAESLKQSIVDACQAFFNLTEEEKKKYLPKHPLTPIKCGSSFNRCEANEFCWRDFINVHVHPKFYSPDQPQGFREPLAEYCKVAREVSLELLRGISESLGLGADYIEKVSEQESGFQLFVANFYPQCPQPELAMGIAPHTDDGFLNLLIQNGIGGLQLLHNDKWVNVNAIPTSILFNVCDQLEILSNGKYKAVLHRAGVSGSATRISIAVSLAPALEAEVAPAPELTDENNPPKFRPMKYGEYLKEVHGDYTSDSVLDLVRINQPASN